MDSESTATSAQQPTDDDIPNLPGHKLRAVELLAAGQPQTRVAKAIGVDRHTVKVWLKDDDFAQAVETQKRRLKQLITDPAPWIAGTVEWQAKLPGIMRALAETASDSKNPRQPQAAKIILEHMKPDGFDPEPTADQKVIEDFIQRLTNKNTNLVEDNSDDGA